MSNAYTVLWTQERCRRLRGEVGRPLQVLFGGVHQSAPSLRRAGIGRGDVVFPVSVADGKLYVLARVVIDTFVELADYAVKQLGLDPPSIAGLHEYQIAELIQQRCGRLGHRVPYGCGIEVALAAQSTLLRFNHAVPPAHLADIRFCPQRGVPMGLRHVKDGRLAKSISLQGNVRRLCPQSAALFSSIVATSDAEAAPAPQEPCQSLLDGVQRGLSFHEPQ